MSGARTTVRLAATALLAVAVALVMVPRLRLATTHRAMSEAIFDPKSQRHDEALDYFATPADPDDEFSPARFFLIPSLGERLDALDGPSLASVHDAYAGEREFVARYPEAHLRAVLLKLETDDSAGYAHHALAQASLAQGETDALAKRIIDTLEPHEDPTVRRAAIEHAAWRFGPSALPRIERAINDASPDVARAAWLMLPHLGPTGGYRANVVDRELGVAEAVLLASTLLDGEAAQELLLRAVAQRPDLADAASYARAWLNRDPRPSVRFESIDPFTALNLADLKEREKSTRDIPERAMLRLAITAREPTDDGIDEAMLLARDGLLPRRELFGALLSIGRSREVMRVLLDTESGERTLRGEHGAVLRNFFSESSFRVPVPDVIPPEPRCPSLAYDALRAWWTCVGNRAAFDTASRSYTLKTPAKTGKATHQ